MKVKSESKVAQLCLTLCDPMDYSLPGSSIHGIFPGKSTGVGCLLRFSSHQNKFQMKQIGYVTGEKEAIKIYRLCVCVCVIHLGVVIMQNRC